MIQMGQAGDLQLAGSVELHEQVRERDRIGSARQRNDDARIASREIVPPDRLPDAIKKLHDLLVRRGAWPACPTRPKGGAGGQIRTVDPALMRRVLSPTELLRPELLMLTRCARARRDGACSAGGFVGAELAPPHRIEGRPGRPLRTSVVWTPHAGRAASASIIAAARSGIMISWWPISE